MDERYRQVRAIWFALAVLVPVMPYAVGLSPFLVEAMFPGDDGFLIAPTLVVGYVLAFALVVYQLLLTKRLAARRLFSPDGKLVQADSSGFWVVAIVEACWVVIMNVLSIWGWMNIG